VTPASHALASNGPALCGGPQPPRRGATDGRIRPDSAARLPVGLGLIRFCTRCRVPRRCGAAPRSRTKLAGPSRRWGWSSLARRGARGQRVCVHSGWSWEAGVHGGWPACQQAFFLEVMARRAPGRRRDGNGRTCVKI
jgi:hypothetical protein